MLGVRDDALFLRDDLVIKAKKKAQKEEAEAAATSDDDGEDEKWEKVAISTPGLEQQETDKSSPRRFHFSPMPGLDDSVQPSLGLEDGQVQPSQRLEEQGLRSPFLGGAGDSSDSTSTGDNM